MIVECCDPFFYCTTYVQKEQNMVENAAKASIKLCV